MKSLTLILAGLFVTVQAQIMLPHRHGAGHGTATDPCDHTGYVVKQNFEGTGYDHCETWTTSGTGSMDPDYTGTNVLEGAQSLVITTSGQTGADSTDFAAMQEVWAYFMMKAVAIDSSLRIIASLNFNDPSSPISSIQVTTTKKLRLAMGGTTADTADSIATNTVYHVWTYYKQGNTNAGAYLGFSTDGTQPFAGNKFVSITNRLSAGSIGTISMGRSGTSSTHTYVYDKVRVKASEIGDNPE